MRAGLAAVIVGGFIFAGGPSHGRPPQRPESQRHRMAACMNKLMSASRQLSYNGATTLCRAQLAGPKPVLASAGGPAAGGLERQGR